MMTPEHTPAALSAFPQDESGANISLFLLQRTILEFPPCGVNHANNCIERHGQPGAVYMQPGHSGHV